MNSGAYMSGKLLKYIIKPSKIIMSLGHRGFFNWMDDEHYLKMVYRIQFGKKLNLVDPQTYSEKIQWLKINDRKPEYTMMVDKCEVKKYVAGIIGEEHVIPTLGVWNRFEDIDFSTLPDQFVLKCTHDSGGLAICKDISKFEIDKARKGISNCLKHNYYFGLREWPYKNVKPRIIAEKYMEDSQTHDLRDYKFFAFDGDVKALFIASERYGGSEPKFDFFDADYNHLPIKNGHPNADELPPKPICFDQMKEFASKLSKGFHQIRVDFYEVNGEVYFGELTFSHWSGLVPYEPEEWDYHLGSWIVLPTKGS